MPVTEQGWGVWRVSLGPCRHAGKAASITRTLVDGRSKDLHSDVVALGIDGMKIRRSHPWHACQSLWLFRTQGAGVVQGVGYTRMPVHGSAIACSQLVGAEVAPAYVKGFAEGTPCESVAIPDTSRSGVVVACSLPPQIGIFTSAGPLTLACCFDALLYSAMGPLGVLQVCSLLRRMD